MGIYCIAGAGMPYQVRSGDLRRRAGSLPGWVHLDDVAITTAERGRGDHRRLESSSTAIRHPAPHRVQPRALPPTSGSALAGCQHLLARTEPGHDGGAVAIVDGGMAP